jgi:hypothetical protein
MTTETELLIDLSAEPGFELVPGRSDAAQEK